MNKSVCINNQWVLGSGIEMASSNPLDGAIVWRGGAADAEQVNDAVQSARTAFSVWRKQSLNDRMVIVNRFMALLSEQQDAFANLITTENGKALWDAKMEVAAMLGKAAISLKAYQDRTGVVEKSTPQGRLSVRHKPHGVLAVFGPFNFPGHLPNGHIIPALLAGNTVVFKPSELTPAVAEMMVKLWHQAGLPPGVLNLLPGDKSTGVALLANAQLDGVLFTGSAQTGRYLHQQYSGQPEKVLALEMGGNNPLLIEAVDDMKSALFITLFSAFVSSGQRCTCARRLLVPKSSWGDQFVDELQRSIQTLSVADGAQQPQPFMGAVISSDAVTHLLDGVQLLKEVGGRVLIESRFYNAARTLMTPCLVDMSDAQQAVDEELFGPILQLYRYQNLDQAIGLANDTRFGLAAGMVTQQQSSYDYFYDNIRAGIVNCNKPLTGASSEAPFGGIGASGNFNPSAYYAADYCAYPVASLSDHTLRLPTTLPPGIDVCLGVK